MRLRALRKVGTAAYTKRVRTHQESPTTQQKNSHTTTVSK